MRKDYNDQIKRKQLQKEDMASLMKKMGEKWSKLPKREKEMFNEAARHDKERYEHEMEEFKVYGDQDKNIQDYDAQRPKKCLSSYMIFVRETRPKVAAELKANNKEDDASLNVMKIVGKRWKQLTKKEKEIFDEKAQEDKIRYEKEMAEFNKAIDKVDIQTTDERRGKNAEMKASKHKHKRKHKKSIDNQAEYYYPVKNSGDQEKETSPPRITYSLRKRNKKADVSYVEKSEDEFDDEDFNDQKPKAQKVGSHPNQQANKPGRKRMNDPEDIHQRNKRTKTQEEDHEDDANYQMQNSLVDSQRYYFNNMNHMYPARQPQGAQFRNRQPFIGNDFNMVSRGFEPEYNFNQSTMRPKSDLIPRRQSSNVMPMNAEPRTQGGNPGMKRERRSKKYFDQKFISQPEMDDYINPINSEFLEQRSGSNNRLGLNEDKGTEKSNKNSILFPFQEEEENNSSNKDLPPENDLRQINDQLQENEPSLGEEVNKLATKDL